MARKLNKRRQQESADALALKVDCTALYIRVSTDKQADEGFSLDAQREKLEAYCKAHAWTVCPEHVYVDAGVSAKTAERPDFQAMLRAARDGEVKRIVALKLDRLARNTRDFLATVDDLTAIGCDLVLVQESFDTSTPHGKFALTLFAAMAEMERSVIAERTMAGRRQKAKGGGYNGSRVPFGYAFDGEGFTINPVQAETVRHIFDLFIDGQSLSAIANRLNALSIPTQRGGSWYASTVRYVLQNGFYAGLVQYDGIEVEGDHATIIAPEVYDAAWRRLEQLRPGPVAA